MDVEQLPQVLLGAPRKRLLHHWRRHHSRYRHRRMYSGEDNRGSLVLLALVQILDRFEEAASMAKALETAKGLERSVLR